MRMICPHVDSFQVVSTVITDFIDRVFYDCTLTFVQDNSLMLHIPSHQDFELWSWSPTLGSVDIQTMAINSQSIVTVKPCSIAPDGN